jgi:arabinogalactan endo-1,4-beta-galactosidase
MKKNDFRMSLSTSIYSGDFETKGIRYTDGNTIASTRRELQELFCRHGANEVWVRINMQRTGDKKRSAALKNSVPYLELAAEMGLPVNPELLCVGDYMDFSRQDTVNLEQYPELKIPKKPWAEYTLDEMCDALEQYAEAVAKEILSYGCKVNIWDIGNETNFGFAGVNVGITSAVNHKLGVTSCNSMYIRPHFGANWLEKNVWCYNAKMFSAVVNGVKKVDHNAKFSVHIATVVADTYYAVKYYKTLMKNGFTPDEAGISFYPSTPGPWRDQMKKFKNIVNGIYKECGLPVVIAEYAYPSKDMTEGEFKSWNHMAKGYPISEEGSAKFMKDIITWGKDNGLAGIRPFAPDYMEEWEPMGLFNYDKEKNIGIAKKALLELVP